MRRCSAHVFYGIHILILDDNHTPRDWRPTRAFGGAQRNVLLPSPLDQGLGIIDRANTGVQSCVSVRY
jgi:hypothetical protein